MLLVLIAGYVDAFGLIQLQTFVSFMSGNTTTSGMLVGAGSFAAAVPALVAVAFFVCGVLCGSLVGVAAPENAQRICFALVSGFIVAYIVFARNWPLGGLPGIAMLSIAMGMLNTTVSRIGFEPVNIGYVSGTLSRMADHLARAIARQPLPDAQTPADSHERRAVTLAGVWLAFLGGAIGSGAATLRFGVDALVLPLAVLLLFSVQEGRQPAPPR